MVNAVSAGPDVIPADRGREGGEAVSGEKQRRRTRRRIRVADRRTVWMSLRFTPDEKQRIAATARGRGMAPGAWAARTLVEVSDGRPPGRLDRLGECGAALNQIFTELRREGSNFNQLVRALNATGDLPAGWADVGESIQAATLKVELATDELRAELQAGSPR